MQKRNCRVPVFLSADMSEEAPCGVIDNGTARKQVKEQNCFLPEVSTIRRAYVTLIQFLYVIGACSATDVVAAAFYMCHGAKEAISTYNVLPYMFECFDNQKNTKAKLIREFGRRLSNMKPRSEDDVTDLESGRKKLWELLTMFLQDKLCIICWTQKKRILTNLGERNKTSHSCYWKLKARYKPVNRDLLPEEQENEGAESDEENEREEEEAITHETITGGKKRKAGVLQSDDEDE